MLIDTPLINNHIQLKNIFESDCTEQYVNWLNNKEVNVFLDSYWIPQSIETVKNFVTEINRSNNSLLLGIFYTDFHVGNIKLGPINQIHNTAFIGYLIGEKKFWNRGIATQAIKMMCHYAFDTLKIHKIYAGVRVNNIASCRSLQKCGFIQEACFHKDSKYLYHDNYVDSYVFGLFKEDLVQ